MRRRVRRPLAVLAAAAVLVAGVLPLATSAGPGSSSTTTTTLEAPPPTTTLDPGVDVTGGARIRSSFAAGQSDLFVFSLAAPAVLMAETSDGKGFCAVDTVMTLRQGTTVLQVDDDSGPGQCSKILRRLDTPGDYSLTVAGFNGVSAATYVMTVQFYETECGNAVVEPLEECDDGNMDAGDCCSPSCLAADDGSPCDDGLACDGADTCLAGACTQHELAPCPGADGDSDCAESCSDSEAGCTFPDPGFVACDDGVFCNGPDRCQAGLCSVHAGDPCPGPDGDGDCSEVCSESADACTANDADGLACDDALFCNGADTCQAGSCALHAGTPCPGPDGDADCSETCSESAKKCSSRDPNGSPCSDGLFCTGADTCSAGTCSAHAGNACAGPDGDADCAESCNEATDACGATDPNGAPCDDGVFCNGPDQCSGGTCSVHLGNPCPGPDGDGNCAESCNEAADACSAPDANGSPCNNGTFCDGADTCSNGACSVSAGNPCPGADGDGNCSETCNESADACTGADPNGSACNDGLFCNGADTCSAGACSGHVGSPCPGADGDANCAESCNEATDACTAADPNGSACNDGLFCNGADTCSTGACSGHAGSPCPGADGDANCAESCNEATDACTANDANGSPCNNGTFCDGADTCSNGACSVSAGNPCPGPDGDANCAETCNEAADNCTSPDANGAACNDGQFCNGADTCASGACSGHVGNPCPGPDGDSNCAETCNEGADACNANDGNGSPCNDGQFCNGADTCQAGACSQHAGSPCPGADGDSNCAESCNEATDACNAADPNGSACNDGQFCDGTDTCSAGACSVSAGNPCPGADGDSNCAESCNEATDACTAADTNGSACSDGLFCNGADTCQGGQCTGHAGDPCPGADGDGNCSETCNETADTCAGPDSNGAPCDDGLFCNGADTCSAGACSVHAGSPCPGADGDGNCAETCNEAADTCNSADPNGSACTDGLFCNGTDTCQGGQCSGHAGDPCPGPDGDGNCTETCSEAADACTAFDANGSACTDGLFCNGADTCQGGQCSGHAGDPCPGPDGDASCAESCNEAGDSCTAADANGSACNDGLFCNGADTCASGACSGHAGDPCPGPDGDGNCSEACNETADACTAADPDGSACNDGLLCNGTDTCAAGGCTTHSGSPCPGADGDANCAESCSDSTPGCTFADPAGSPCDDGIFCNGPDRCSGGSCSVHLGDPCAGPDGDANCAESCNEAADTCTAADPDGSACSDGTFCNGADTCAAGSCSVHPGNPCPGPDGDANCAESCSEAADACTAADPNGSSCNDGLFCDGADTCSAGACSVSSGNPCPGADGDSNCAESCNEAADACTAADPNGSSCNDGAFCNGTDSCAAGACSTHSGNPCPGPDGDANCAESCSEVADACTAADADGIACDDGVFCNGADTCAGGACTGHAGNPCPGPDGDLNCKETCSEAADACNANDPDASPCSDGLFCNGSESCSAGACSVRTAAPCPGADGDANCAESCNEATDACNAADPAGAACNDGAFCNGADSCSAGACSQHAGNPCPGADGDADCSEGCSEAADACTLADANGAPCSDGLFCNGADTCQGGECGSHAGDPCPGPDGDGNCSETCSEAAGACTGPDPGGSPCSDGLFCNGADTCAAGECSGHAGDPCSGGDGDANCKESCSEAGDACTANDPAGSTCSDSKRCTTTDACNGSGACTPGPALSCDDGDACTTDACVETGEACTHAPVPNCPPTGLVCGDVNGDDKVSAGDALSVLQSAVGGPKCDARFCACDVNANGSLAASDALLVLRHAVGLAVVLACDCGE